MNNLLEQETIQIENMIYEVRGKQVMLDSDLAKLYDTSTGNLNRVRNRNKDRFPDDFCFQLSRNEYINLKCQNGISNIDGRTINRNLPYVYTEQGVSMLASLLRTEKAIQISISIIRAFVTMRKYLSNNLLEQKYINNMVLEHDYEIKILKETFSNFKEKNNHIFFEGQIYDAYSLLLDIFDKSENEIIIIDNYADKKLLDIVSKTNITIVSSNMDNNLIEKYEKQYNNLTIINNNSFHDRFIIIDRKNLYHCGSSFKDLGKKCFGINLIEDENILENILKELKEKEGDNI